VWWLVLDNEERGSPAAGVLVDADLICILGSYACVGGLPSSLPPLLSLLLTLLDLFTYVAESVWVTFEYNSIANVKHAVRRSVSKGGDDARHRLLDCRSFVLLKVALAGQWSIAELWTEHLEVYHRVEQSERRLRGRVKDVMKPVEKTRLRVGKMGLLSQLLRIVPVVWFGNAATGAE
jgi:hypothetical protein